jgi:hypothetical protein
MRDRDQTPRAGSSVRAKKSSREARRGGAAETERTSRRDDLIA